MSTSTKRYPLPSEQYKGGGASQKFGNKGIVPGAHPEFDQGTKLGNPIHQIGSLIQKLRKPRAK